MLRRNARQRRFKRYFAPQPAVRTALEFDNQFVPLTKQSRHVRFERSGFSCKAAGRRPVEDQFRLAIHPVGRQPDALELVDSPRISEAPNGRKSAPANPGNPRRSNGKASSCEAAGEVRRGRQPRPECIPRGHEDECGAGTSLAIGSVTYATAGAELNQRAGTRQGHCNNTEN